MNAINRTTTQAQANVNTLDAASRITVTLMGSASALIGLWAVACFAAALIGNGPLGLIKAYFSAVTGI
ncbi:MAG: hypothetical protein KKG47_02245 [Proteobacteria bacterium]|nr:hypothetical protein [Pseudomonadota bacterium]MBU1737399.1 hypothetical protein [Pseudomonadota bacterium]